MIGQKKMLHSPELLGVAFLILIIALWSKIIWGGWAEKIVAAGKAPDTAWFWLRTFSIPQTPINRIRFIKAASILGIVPAAFGIVGLTVTSLDVGL